MNVDIKTELIKILDEELKSFRLLNYKNSIVINSIPILWFGDSEKYFCSKERIVTVSLNPSDNEFRIIKEDSYSPKYRFPSFNTSGESLYNAYNEYYYKRPYDSWFKASFRSVLESFSASHYHAENIALHTDIGSPYATSPTWSGLNDLDRSILESQGSKIWHKLMRIFEPDVILYSASNGFENKIAITSEDKTWTRIDVNSDTPLLVRRYKFSENKVTWVLFQVQGRKPFLRTKKVEKLKFSEYIK